MKIVKGFVFVAVSLIVIIAIVVIVAVTRYKISQDKPADQKHTMVKVESYSGRYSNFDIYYDAETRVMYMVEYHGGINVLVEADGSPKLYKGSDTECIGDLCQKNRKENE